MNRQLRQIATHIRKDVVRMHQRGTNVGSAMSAVDILTVLYFGGILDLPAPEDPKRDRFILSKGHAVSALYAILARRGLIDPALLSDYLVDGSPLTGHPSMGSVPGIEVSTGSLGHGLPIAVGMALAARRDHSPHRVFVLAGDGELQEGTMWEAAILAAKLHLDNLTTIVDINGLQGYGRVADLMPLDSIEARWRAFGWEAGSVDGHDLPRLREVLSQLPLKPGKPSVLLARTIKGKGIAEMENELGWHYFSVPPEKLQPFLDELERA